MKKHLRIPSVLTAFTLLVSPLAGFSVAGAQVVPDMVDETMPINTSINVDKTVHTPEIPPKLDFLLLVDLSGSYADDLPNIKAVDDGLYDSITAIVPDSRFALASFVDYPFSPYGGGGDYSYLLNQDFTTSKATWTGAISAMTTFFGGDFPESQYEALFQSAGVAWRPDATRVIAITTDASFHDSDTEGGYPGTGGAATIAALTGAGVRVIAIKAPGASTQMDDVATATGGSVQTTGASSVELADAVIAGLGSLPITVTPHVVGCDPLDVTYAPASMTVVSGDPAHFVETITVPNDPSLMGTSVHCSVVFTDENGNELGEQMIWIRIPDTQAPEAQCIPTVNPHGKNVPKAGEKSTGMNEDGFYQLLAKDNVDETPAIWVNGFGPFVSGDKVKITESNDTPSMKKMGSTNGNAGAIATHLKLNTDAVVTAVDGAGNISPVAVCLVPKHPK